MSSNKPTGPVIREMTVNFAEEIGRIRALNGVNLGPLSMNGHLDLSEGHRQLKIPSTRLHDCPYVFADAVDIHAVFPDFDADPKDPSRYRFEITDDYIRSVLDVGSQIVFRLGESIEHTKRKYWVHPPKNYEKWADICIQIIRHYNEGWSNGFRYGIRHWEIWNEPWNGTVQWTGTAEEWIRFYGVVSKRIKNECPATLVGSPSLSAQESLVGGSTSFGRSFLAHCRAVNAPLDFFSWHIYATNPEEIPYWARRLRDLVDEYGFSKAEMHLNEWNYFRAEPWDKANFEVSCGPEGAAFDAATLCTMQDLPIDAANFYWAAPGWFGLFDTYGSANKNFYAFLAFARVLETPRRVLASGERSAQGRTILAGLAQTGRMARVIVANFKDEIAETELVLNELPWSKVTRIERALLDDTHSLGVIPPRAYRAEARERVAPDVSDATGALRVSMHSESVTGRPVRLSDTIPPLTVVLYTLSPEGENPTESEALRIEDIPPPPPSTNIRKTH